MFSKIINSVLVSGWYYVSGLHLASGFSFISGWWLRVRYSLYWYVEGIFSQMVKEAREIVTGEGGEGNDVVRSLSAMKFYALVKRSFIDQIDKGLQ